MLPRRQERGRRLLGRSRGRLPSRAEEGDGTDTRGRAVNGYGARKTEEGAAAVARVKLGWRGLLGRARRAAGLAAGAGSSEAQGGGELGWGKN